MQTKFPTNLPSHARHARALTLKAMGDELLKETGEQLVGMDNSPEYDLNPEKGLVVLSAASGDFVADISMKYDQETSKIRTFQAIPAPGTDEFSFDSFSYTLDASGRQGYVFDINGRPESVAYDPKTDTITTDIPVVRGEPYDESRYPST